MHREKRPSFEDLLENLAEKLGVSKPIDSVEDLRRVAIACL